MGNRGKEGWGEHPIPSNISKIEYVEHPIPSPNPIPSSIPKITRRIPLGNVREMWGIGGRKGGVSTLFLAISLKTLQKLSIMSRG